MVEFAFGVPASSLEHVRVADAGAGAGDVRARVVEDLGPAEGVVRIALDHRSCGQVGGVPRVAEGVAGTGGAHGDVHHVAVGVGVVDEREDLGGIAVPVDVARVVLVYGHLQRLVDPVAVDVLAHHVLRAVPLLEYLPPVVGVLGGDAADDLLDPAAQCVVGVVSVDGGEPVIDLGQPVPVVPLKPVGAVFKSFGF